MRKLEGKVAVITGGAKGIGFGISKALAKEGANLVITGRTQSSLHDAKASIETEFGVRVFCVAADVGNEAAVQNIFDKTDIEYGRVDIVINNAQVSKSGVLLQDHTKEDFDVAILSGLYGTFYMMRAAFPYLKKSHGSVVNFASGAGLFGKIGQSSYAAAKEGVRGMSRVAAAEWGEYGINVNVICPLVMTEGLAAWKLEYPELYEKTIQDIPMRRFADAEKDIGRAVVFLCSEDGKFITGETITMQGGSGLRP